jgi:hypothetical protein
MRSLNSKFYIYINKGVMLKVHLVHLLSIPKIEIKHKVNVDKNNFLHF